MSSSIRHWIWLSVAPRFRHNLCHARLSIHHAQFLTNEMAGAQKHHNFQVDIFWSFSHHIYLRMPDQNPFEQTAESFKVAFGIIARTMNFVCSIFPDCCLWIENSALFHHFSSTWIPEDINAAIAACFVFAIKPLIVSHTYWQWVSALVAVSWSHRFCLLHLKDASAHRHEVTFTHSCPSFCFPLKSSTLRHSTLYTSDDTQANSERKSVDCQRSSIAAGSKFSEMQIFLLFVFNIEI